MIEKNQPISSMDSLLKDNLQKEIKQSLEVLHQGGIILYPTDTVWGIGCDATNKEAVKKVCRLKGKLPKQGLIVLIEDVSKLKLYVDKVPAIAYTLIKQAKHPLTIIYPEMRGLSENVIAKDGSIAIRVVKEKFCRELIKKLNKPLVSTSANKSGDAAPESYKDIKPKILKGVDYIVDLYREKTYIGKPSTIIKLGVNGETELIRK